MIQSTMDFEKQLVSPVVRSKPKRDYQPTSREAFKRAKFQLSGRQLIFLQWLLQQPDGATREEASIALEWPHYIMSSITQPLLREEQIRLTGTYRKTKSGSNAQVLAAIPYDDQYDEAEKRGLPIPTN